MGGEAGTGRGTVELGADDAIESAFTSVAAIGGEPITDAIAGGTQVGAARGRGLGREGGSTEGGRLGGEAGTGRGTVEQGADETIQGAFTSVAAIGGEPITDAIAGGTQVGTARGRGLGRGGLGREGGSIEGGRLCGIKGATGAWGTVEQGADDTTEGAFTGVAAIGGEPVPDVVAGGARGGAAGGGYRRVGGEG